MFERFNDVYLDVIFFHNGSEGAVIGDETFTGSIDSMILLTILK